MKVKRFSAISLVVTAAVSLVVTLGGVFLVAWSIIGPQGLTLLEGMALINTRFVGDYERDKVLDAAMYGMVAGLGDRWSYYLNPASYQANKEQRENIYVGIGITLSFEREEGLLLLHIVPGGPADLAGLKAGEIITAVGDQPVSGEARQTASALIRGEAGSTVALTLLGEDGTSRTVNVMRDTVQEDPVTYELLDSGEGYIKVKNFYARSANQVKAAVEALQLQGATALVFDMRNNGGGYLDELTRMLDGLLPEGPIFRVTDRAGNEKITQSDAACVRLPMAVLVNKDTYSAAEFFAGELREQGVAVVVGMPTSGKGYSQQTYPLFGGGAMGISTSQYATGKGVSLVGTGITLDREIDLSKEDAVRLLAGKLPYAQDVQLQMALEQMEKLR